ncbi:MAG: 4'-phosphopantetheinyl transferase superfamily protein [Brumimicrobium sp.]|nr:4'-phosphopantetheinyl transferase superfamily protein [Brumimicrobium sp.]
MWQYENISIGKVTIYLLRYERIDLSKLHPFLLPDEIDKITNYGHNLKQEEFAATRILRTQVFGKVPVFYSEIGAPYIKQEGYISISHSYNVVGIAYCKDFLVGLDLEPIREKALLVKHKFLSDSEYQNNDTSSEEEMTKIWSGKEALYKLAGRKKIIFKENLLLQKIIDNTWKGELVFPETHKEVEMQLIKKDNFIISVNSSPVYEINR